MVSLSLIQLPLNKDSFIAPASIYTAFFNTPDYIHTGSGGSGDGGPWEWWAVIVNTQHANLFNITRFRSRPEVDRLACGVTGQNGIGQNGTDKMVRTKWHGQNGSNCYRFQFN